MKAHGMRVLLGTLVATTLTLAGVASAAGTPPAAANSASSRYASGVAASTAPIATELVTNRLSPQSDATLAVRVRSAGTCALYFVNPTHNRFGPSRVFSVRLHLIWTWRVASGAEPGRWQGILWCRPAGKRTVARRLIVNFKVNGGDPNGKNVPLYEAGSLHGAGTNHSPVWSGAAGHGGGKGGYSCADAHNGFKSVMDPKSGYCTGYCTEYVWSFRHDLGFLGDAGSWYGAASASERSTTPVKGAVAWWPAGTKWGGAVGHVAYVTDVGNGTVTVTEMNITGWNIVDTRGPIPLTSPEAPKGYIVPPNTAPQQPPFDPNAYVGHIVKQNNGSVASWLVISTSAGPRRNWIPDQATFNCLRSAGHPFDPVRDLLSADQLNKIPDQNGIWASCSTPPPPPPPTGDKTAPSTPSGLSASGLTTSSITLGWSASTDNVGVTGYKVFLNGGQVTTTTGTSYTFGGLGCGTGYTLGVAAYDAAGNTSSTAQVASATISCPPPSTWTEIVGPYGSNTFTNYTNAGGTMGAHMAAGQSIQITCRLTGWTAPDGNNWWYKVASSPWNNQFYAPADNFWNNGQSSGTFKGTPFYDPAVPMC